ncbi:MAG: cytochrome D ubiquinol oxidase subunit I [Elusimicrobia bacterium RIFCSPHIGHO2_02_FULL_61_10]|nr:MAG: cytochrome D ubiquinol oxidase subunit I [Elusimicrobia bacterium RIFCSPLOWO2_02_FULL_61_11]OGS27465.1 MAG: cytochrome D ubiquinol oxidase subunit I [Elusimicrobia bacterium RIFCSPHIGHO2_02_FULL_61_10]
MDTLALSRLQFAVTAMFHFLFVPLTLGLGWLTAWFETRYARSGDENYLRLARFWGKLFLINFALGVVTGITMEFQLGMNWAEYSRYVGDIFGAPLAIEAMAAFFLESTFIGVWVFGWERLSRKAHAASMWIVAFATNMSALWILLANGWMQHPVGYVLRNGRAEMVDFKALLLNPYGWLEFFHTVFSGWVVAGFFVMGVSAWHLLRKNQEELFKKSFGAGAVFALASSLLVAGVGDMSAVNAAKNQPAKFAAMESVWETRTAAPYTLLVVPRLNGEGNAVEALKVPYALSLMAFHDPHAEVKGLKDFLPQDRPPVLPVFLGFRTMVALGALFILLSALGVFLWRKDLLGKYPLFLKAMLFAIPLPYIAIQFGWLVTEMGRQPWAVYGLMRTAEGVSKTLAPAQVWLSLGGFTLLYSALGAVDFWLLAKYARKGMEA